MIRRWGWTIPLVITGCATLGPLGGREAELVLYPHFSQELQTIVNQNTLSSIATLDIVPYIEESPNSYSPISSTTGNPTTLGAADMLKLSQASPTIDPNRPVVIRRLKPGKNYRIFGRGYNSDNVLISLDASSFVDVAVGNNDAPSMAQLPVSLTAIPFAASTSVTVNTDGRYDYLKSTLYLVSGNTQVALSQTTRNNPDFIFANLQGNTNYRFVVEAYKLGGIAASNSLNLAISNDTAPSTFSLPLSIPLITTTVAGNGVAGFADAVGTAAMFNNPFALTIDLQGNLYVGDRTNQRIRKITPAGGVTTLAGNGSPAYADGTGTAAMFYDPLGLVADSQGNLYVGDWVNNRVRKVTQSGVVTTVAGNSVSALVDGTGTAASLGGPIGLVLDSQGNLFVAEHNNCAIRKITPAGVVTTIAGGSQGFADGTGTAAKFNIPIGIAIDSQGNLYVTDRENHRIRKVTQSGVVTTVAGNGATAFSEGTGTSATFYAPYGITADLQDNLYVGDMFNQRIRKITPSMVVTTLVGNGGTAFAEGTNATFNSPHAVVLDPLGNLYVADYNNQRIRKIQ